MTALAASRTPSALDVVRLHIVKRRSVFVTPLFIVAAVFVVTTIIALALQRVGGSPDTADLIDGARQNPALAWAFSGFIVALGVQSVSTAFPFALALGATRRTFTLGTLLTNAVLAAYLTAIFLVLLALELLTGHWFANVHLVDVYVLGAGDVRLLVPITFLGALALLSLGSVFGASHVRFAAYGPAALGIGLGLVLALSLLLFAPALPAFFAAFQLWWLTVVAIGIVLTSSLGALAFLRSASVR
jgi:hypothetical protein